MAHFAIRRVVITRSVERRPYSPTATTVIHIALHLGRGRLSLDHLLETLIEFGEFVDYPWAEAGLTGRRIPIDYDPEGPLLDRVLALAAHLSEGFEAVMPEHLLLAILEVSPYIAEGVITDPPDVAATLRRRIEEMRNL